jgi:branched-chain amino acid transport system substrate-binding protein
MHRRTLLTSAAVIAAADWFSQAKADMPGVTATEIKIGNTWAYSGPASSYAGAGKLFAAFFRMINEHGGINGRKISFISLDDGYSPPKTVEQTRKLVEEEDVAFIFAGLGTASQTAVHKYMNAKAVPQLFISSPADKWADPEHYHWSIGFTPTARTCGAIFGRYLLQQKPNAKIGVLYQNDDYGKDNLIGLKQGLGGRSGEMVEKEVSYEPTDATIDSQVVTLHSAGVDVVFTAAIPKFTAQTIRKLADLGWKPLHMVPYTTSSVAAALAPAGLENAVGLIRAAWARILQIRNGLTILA